MVTGRQNGIKTTETQPESVSSILHKNWRVARVSCTFFSHPWWDCRNFRENYRKFWNHSKLHTQSLFFLLHSNSSDPIAQQWRRKSDAPSAAFIIVVDIWREYSQHFNYPLASPSVSLYSLLRKKKKKSAAFLNLQRWEFNRFSQSRHTNSDFHSRVSFVDSCTRGLWGDYIRETWESFNSEAGRCCDHDNRSFSIDNIVVCRGGQQHHKQRWSRQLISFHFHHRGVSVAKPRKISILRIKSSPSSSRVDHNKSACGSYSSV